jgi:hypothetical protein
MIFAVALTATAAFLSVAAIVILVILVAAIHRDDRAKNLTSAPRSRTEKATRRLLGVGVRATAASDADAQPSPSSSSSSPKGDLP